MKELLNYTAAINDEVRLQLLAFLHLHKKLCVCELCESFNMIQSRISRHLKILKNANLLISTRNKAYIYYEINYENKHINVFLSLINDFDLKLPKLKKIECKD
ncbi:ArsR/SmtB family transcription factor [Campylobacter canadensis]|uniref:Winged helix-turn-helix transcriptional regulator n=1 Tax=Campylobacter canadensis TaxID=449520 RepID=A0ABS7WT65_9BACT|nr:metalloregulator ArsR/SmtB family transcription factor [Campylobacter canadensis]MBZ7987953.1 winged helix-turn-helix transcriptional regulator [Campylobacter canadensis]MBZ7995046.1 winged helix-turn-helix transcriptional regulator [Campylobacter canadensis]MBZ7996677.1 winged helix-turn-helix transcriptional regulator [Campylobacter canadensis]MBZ7998520.1 winged helix-turn-helix transcriptional regulator [Campylobacter canadensis]MBZ8000284.1 winged helix-turn-helix transcriptional regul